MDSELIERKPVKRPHGQVVGTAIVDSKLLCEIVQRIEGMAGIEAFPFLAMAALDFAVMARGIRTNGLVPNAQLGSSLLKHCWQITFAAGEANDKLGAADDAGVQSCPGMDFCGACLG